MFTTLTVVMIWAYAYVQFHQNVHIKQVQFFCISCVSQSSFEKKQWLDTVGYIAKKIVHQLYRKCVT